MNRLEVFNEVMIIITSIHMLLFTDFIPCLEDQHKIGWSFISFLWLTIGVNAVIILFFSFKAMYLIGVKYTRIIYDICVIINNN